MVYWTRVIHIACFIQKDFGKTWEEKKSRQEERNGRGGKKEKRKNKLGIALKKRYYWNIAIEQKHRVWLRMVVYVGLLLLGLNTI